MIGHSGVWMASNTSGPRLNYHDRRWCDGRSMYDIAPTPKVGARGYCEDGGRVMSVVFLFCGEHRAGKVGEAPNEGQLHQTTTGGRQEVHAALATTLLAPWVRWYVHPRQAHIHVLS